MAQATVNATARLAGGLHLATVPFGFFGLAYVSSIPVVGAGHSLQAAVRLLRFGILSNVIGLVLFTLAVLALYEVFIKGVNVGKWREVATGRAPGEHT